MNYSGPIVAVVVYSSTSGAVWCLGQVWYTHSSSAPAGIYMKNVTTTGFALWKSQSSASSDGDVYCSISADRCSLTLSGGNSLGYRNISFRVLHF